jgi:hypothetical protein
MTAREDAGTLVQVTTITVKHIIMEARISGYFKTEHFLYRQWDRGVTDDLLKAVLPSEVSLEKQLFVVSRKITKKYLKNCKTELLIKTDGKTLITCFYCDFQDYFFNAKKIENYFFIKNLKTNNHGKA